MSLLCNRKTVSNARIASTLAPFFNLVTTFLMHSELFDRTLKVKESRSIIRNEILSKFFYGTKLPAITDKQSDNMSRQRYLAKAIKRIETLSVGV
jgi:hypothetical protein